MCEEKRDLFLAVAEDLSFIIEKCATKYTVMGPRALLIAGDVLFLKGQTDMALKKWTKAQSLASKLSTRIDSAALSIRISQKALPTMDDLIDKLDAPSWDISNHCGSWRRNSTAMNEQPVE